jgi:hypothetical protein
VLKDGTVTVDEIRTTLGIDPDEDRENSYGISNQVGGGRRVGERERTHCPCVMT